MGTDSAELTAVSSFQKDRCSKFMMNNNYIHNASGIKRPSPLKATRNANTPSSDLRMMQSSTLTTQTEPFQSSNLLFRLTEPSTSASTDHESDNIVTSRNPREPVRENSEFEMEPMACMDSIFSRYKRLMKHKRVPGSSLRQCWIVIDGVLTPLPKCSLSCQFHKITKNSVVSKIAFDGHLEDIRKPIGRFRVPRIPTFSKKDENLNRVSTSAIDEQKDVSSGPPDLTKKMGELEIQDTTMDTN